MNEYVIVTGVPRSGTSMQMQTLKCLGLEIVGDEYPQLKNIKKFIKQKEIKGKDVSEEFLEMNEGPVIGEDNEFLGFIIKQKDSKKFFSKDIGEMKEFTEFFKASKNMNPRGFYEISGAVMRGIQDEKLIKNKAVKIIVEGLPERVISRKNKDGEVEEKIIGTKPEILEKAKIILCLRNPRNVAISQKNLQERNKVKIVNEDNEFVDIKKVFPENPTRYAYEMSKFYFWIKENPEIENKLLKIDFDDMHDKTEQQIDRLEKYLELDCLDEKKQLAIENVTNKLRRSVDFEGWHEQLKESGKVAEMLYEYFKNGKEVDEEFLKEYLKNKYLESVQWIDTEYGSWVKMNCDLWRQMRDMLHVREHMLKYQNVYGQRNCEYYGDFVDEEIEIHRPKDIGNLKQKKIKCLKDGESKVLLQCWACFGRWY